MNDLTLLLAGAGLLCGIYGGAILLAVPPSKLLRLMMPQPVPSAREMQAEADRMLAQALKDQERLREAAEAHRVARATFATGNRRTGSPLVLKSGS